MTENEFGFLKNLNVLIIDDHQNIRLSLRYALELHDAQITEAECFAEGLEKIEQSIAQGSTFDVILMDIRLPDGSGLDLLKKVEEKGLSNKVIMITGEATLQEAFNATNMGSFDFIEKPFTPERIISSLRKCVEFNSIIHDNIKLKEQLSQPKSILGNSDSICAVQALIDRVAPTLGRVLIVGESGTGKELVAKSIHQKSKRQSKPLIKINCAAIPESLIESELFGHIKGAFTGAIKDRKGVFERADGGTLFLDEVGELSLGVQAKLLRILQSGEFSPVGSDETRKVDVRVIAATNRSLEDMIKSNDFREDLYYRLNVVNIYVPPLRERRDDIEYLSEAFLIEACKEHSLGHRAFSAGAMKKMMEYRWPGNIRELKNSVERMCILADSEEIEHFDKEGSQTQMPSRAKNVQELASDAKNLESFAFTCEKLSWHDFQQQSQNAYVRYVLAKSDGNVTEAAKLLDLERAYLHRLMKKLGIQRDNTFR